jgi:hypothetical protein
MSKTSRRLAQQDTAASSEKHVEESAKASAVNSNEVVSTSTAKGLVYSLGETLGVMLGDPCLPEHMRSGYQGLMEMVRKVEGRIESIS